MATAPWDKEPQGNIKTLAGNKEMLQIIDSVPE